MTRLVCVRASERGKSGGQQGPAFERLVCYFLPDLDEDPELEPNERELGALGVGAGRGAATERAAVLAPAALESVPRPGAAESRPRAGTGEPEALALGAPKPPRWIEDFRCSAARVGTRTEDAGAEPTGREYGARPRSMCSVETLEGRVGT
jgi:hypothetical protein